MVESLRTLRLLGSPRRGTRRPPDRLTRLQARLLRDAVAHAAARVPFYRRVWEGVGPDVPLAALPVLSPSPAAPMKSQPLAAAQSLPARSS